MKYQIFLVEATKISKHLKINQTQYNNVFRLLRLMNYNNEKINTMKHVFHLLRLMNYNNEKINTMKH